MMQHNLNIPMGIFPVGTSNDVARQMKIPGKIKEYCQIITEGNLTAIDLGKVADEYFINVAAAGFLTDTAHEVNYSLKNALGKAAYYLKVIEKLPQMRPLHLHLMVDNKTYDLEILLFLMLNGTSTAGFKELLPEGAMSDGLLDFLAFKPVPPLGGLERLLLNYSRGQLLKDENVFYCQGKEFSLELDPAVTTDLDGEEGPGFPWKISICPNALQLRTP
jgi:YegS/Rv2252/BmrU family lipid kinase